MRVACHVSQVNWNQAVKAKETWPDEPLSKRWRPDFVVETYDELTTLSAQIRFIDCLESLRKNARRRRVRSVSLDLLFITMGTVSGHIDYYLDELNLPEHDIVVAALSDTTVSRLSHIWEWIDFGEIKPLFGKKQAQVFYSSSFQCECSEEDTFNWFTQELQKWRTIFQEASSKGCGLVVW